MAVTPIIAKEVAAKLQQKIAAWVQKKGNRPLTIDDVDRLSSKLEDICDDAAEDIDTQDRDRP